MVCRVDGSPLDHLWREGMVIYIFAVSPATLLWLSLQRVPSLPSTVQGSLTRRLLLIEPCLLIAPVCPELDVDFFDTAPPPHDLFAGVLDTAYLPSTGDGSPGLYPVTPEW